jgi:hypothetical protein
MGTLVPLRINSAAGKTAGAALLLFLLAATLSGFPQTKDPKEKPPK